MASWLIAVTVVCYAWTAAELATRGQWAMAAVFVCYAAANVALLFAVSGVR